MTSIRDEYSPTFGRQNLTIWEGGYASSLVGRAVELPRHDGFMVTFLYDDETKLRVACPAPRTDENFHEVDEAIRTAIADSGI